MTPMFTLTTVLVCGLLSFLIGMVFGIIIARTQ